MWTFTSTIPLLTAKITQFNIPNPENGNIWRRIIRNSLATHNLFVKINETMFGLKHKALAFYESSPGHCTDEVTTLSKITFLQEIQGSWPTLSKDSFFTSIVLF